MDDLQATLQSLLNDPEELQQLTQAAASLLGGAAEEEQETEPKMPDLKQIFKMVGGGDTSETSKLIHALTPFLSAQRRTRLERAARIARLSSIAEFALGSEEEHD